MTDEKATKRPVVVMVHDHADVPEDQLPCPMCVNMITQHLLTSRHPAAGGNILLAALTAWTLHVVRPGARGSTLRACAEALVDHARQIEAQEAGDTMPPAQGTA